MECKEYPVDMGCLFLGDAAAKIHPEIGQQVDIKEALAYAEKCRESGLIHLIGRGTIDTFWLNVEPVEKLMTVCNCCPCCCLNRVAIHMPGKAGKMVSKIPGIHVKVTDECTGCGTCTDNCPYGAIRKDGTTGKAVVTDVICKGCGICATNCPEGAIVINHYRPDQILAQVRAALEEVA